MQTHGLSGHSASESVETSLRAASASPVNERASSREPARAEVSFEQVYSTYVEFVWRSARRLGVEEAEADDVVQQVFLTVYQKLDGFEWRSTLKTWLFAILLRVASEYRRAVRRKSQHLAHASVDPDLVPDGGVNPHEALSRAEASRTIDVLLDSLDGDKRAVFVMAELEEMTAAEISLATGLEPSTVYSRLRAARTDSSARLRRYAAANSGATDDRAQSRHARAAGARARRNAAQVRTSRPIEASDPRPGSGSHGGHERRDRSGVEVPRGEDRRRRRVRGGGGRGGRGDRGSDVGPAAELVGDPRHETWRYRPGGALVGIVQADSSRGLERRRTAGGRHDPRFDHYSRCDQDAILDHDHRSDHGSRIESRFDHDGRFDGKAWDSSPDLARDLDCQRDRAALQRHAGVRRAPGPRRHVRPRARGSASSRCRFCHERGRSRTSARLAGRARRSIPAERPRTGTLRGAGLCALQRGPDPRRAERRERVPECASNGASRGSSEGRRPSRARRLTTREARRTASFR